MLEDCVKITQRIGTLVEFCNVTLTLIGACAAERLCVCRALFADFCERPGKRQDQIAFFVAVAVLQRG